MITHAYVIDPAKDAHTDFTALYAQLAALHANFAHFQWKGQDIPSWVRALCPTLNLTEAYISPHHLSEAQPPYTFVREFRVGEGYMYLYQLWVRHGP